MSNRVQGLSSMSIYQAMNVLCHHGSMHSKPLVCLLPSKDQQGTLPWSESHSSKTSLTIHETCVNNTYPPSLPSKSHPSGSSLTRYGTRVNHNYPLHLLKSQASK